MIQRPVKLHRDNSWLVAKDAQMASHKFDRRKTGRGPFKPSQSLDRALFGIRQAGLPEQDALLYQVLAAYELLPLRV